MYFNAIRIRKYIRRIEAMMLVIMITITSFSFSAAATEIGQEQELAYEKEDESEQDNQESVGSIEKEDTELEETKEENPESEEESDEQYVTEQEESEIVENTEQEDAELIENEEVLEQEDFDFEEEFTTEDSCIEYCLQAEASGYKFKLEAYEGVFPEGKELSLSAKKIDNQEVLNIIDSKLSDVCDSEYTQISFDIKVINDAGEELQPDRSRYIDDEDIIPIQLSIEFAGDEIESEVEVFHFADDLSTMECLVSEVEGNEVIVEPEHFSVFTILESRDGSYYSGLIPQKGYRTYIEWMPNSTAGLRRLQKIYVYAEAGEQISFGSSTFLNLSKGEVETSLKDSFGYSVGSAASKASIAVTLPYDPSAMQEKSGATYHIYSSSTNPDTVISQIEGSTAYGDTNIYLFQKEEIDNVNTSMNVSAKGTIYNWQQEALGAKNADNPAGYEPISFIAPVSGVYTFRFFGTQYTKVVTATKVKKTDTFLQKTNNYVGAWDITVTGTGSTTPIKGRTFTDALFWTIGDNVSGDEVVLNESVYALTSDGFEYKVDFNGLDPFGFVFFTNKRGLLVSSDDHEDGHYRSLARSVRSKRNQLDDLIEMGVHLNSTPTTEKDESYFITFEKADSELLNHYTQNPTLSDDESIGTNEAAYKNFKFLGLNSSEDGVGTEGYGGYFSFTYDVSQELTDKILPSTYEIIMDFTGNETLEREYGYAHGSNNEVILSNTLVHGENKIFWDGKDEHGNVVIGKLGGEDYTVVSFNVKAGEVHFPLLDVENNHYGIKVNMQNDLSGIDKAKIYYDNSDSDTYGKNIGDKKEYLTGVSSADGAMAFDKNAGDCCAIDIWADYRVATPVENYKITINEFTNETAFFRAKTSWQYFYTTIDGKKHFDASYPLPNTTEVVLQYRIVDKDTVGIGGVDTSNPKWKTSDYGEGEAWQDYKGIVTVSLQKTDSAANEQIIALDSSSEYIFDKDSGVGTYKSVKIEAYHIELNSDPITRGNYPIDASEGLCVFNRLPLHPDVPDNPGIPDLTRFYQYRVVDVTNTSSEFAYTVDDLFDSVAAVDIPIPTGHVTKDIYLEEIYDYRYRGAETFNLEFDQLWNDFSMSAEWREKHRPKAVKAAILYGIPRYEDFDPSTEDYTTTETGYYGEDVEVVWRKIQQIDYLVLNEDGVYSKDSNGEYRNLSLVSSPDEPYAAYFPVWKYMANGDPYFYRIRPISYSMDGDNFSEIEWDIDHILPKMSLPEFYGVDDDGDDEVNKKYHVIFYNDEVDTGADLYPRAVKFTDVPEKAEIKVTKLDTTNNPIIGNAAAYEIKDRTGKNLMFTLDSEGYYTYEGLEGTSGLSENATKVIETSTQDSIVHACGLPLNEYSIYEVNAPEGYQLNSVPINVAMSDFVLVSSMIDGSKEYLCEKTQVDSLLPEPPTTPTPIPTPTPTPKPSPNPGPIPVYGPIPTFGPNITPVLGSGPDPAPAPIVDMAPVLENKTGNDIVVINTITDENNIESIAGKKLPKTGGLTESLAALILGNLMIGVGIYLTKPSKKRRYNGDLLV